MSRIKLLLVVLLLTAMVSFVPQAQATSVIQVTMAGSSGAWQLLGVGTYNYCVSLSGAANCFHWTSASNVVNLTDTRVTPVNVDPGTAWIVWSVSGGNVTKVWSDDKVDTIVGDRCFYAQPQCTVSATSANLGGSGSSQISSSLWGADTALPSTIVGIFTSGTLVNAAASDVRPEDAAFEACRVNSQLGAGSYGGAASDGLDGLGYNPNNQPGVCPGPGLATANYVGTPIKSAYPGSTSVANVLAFNISGKDPISGTTIPAATVVELGIDPIVAFFERDKGQLTNLQNVSTEQLQAAFSGTNCDASAFGLAPGNIGIFLREPLSGTMTASEYDVFREPSVYTGTGGGAILGTSQESNVNAPLNNPLNNQAGTCLAGLGGRYRGVGAGEVINWVKNSGSLLGTDGIGYTFFSYGNASKFANNPAYGYATLNNVDPLWASYGPQSSTGLGYDPGQPATAGTLPGSANLPVSCGGFPCSEKAIWAGGLSYPNVRSGSYNWWSIIRVISYASAKTAVADLVKGAQKAAVDDIPDFIPAVKTVGATTTDPGLTILRSHYQQYDGAGTPIGAAPSNSTKAEKGGDVGGLILPVGSTTTQQVQGNQGLQVRP
ncbi:MAG: hypothetical protein WBQ72_21630 [Terriglobales bacterium]|jgi:hypothetical protein